MSRKNLFHEDILLDEEEEWDFDTEVPEAEDYLEGVLDDLIGANNTLQHNGKIVMAKIMKQDIGTDGKPIGKYDHNPILDSRKYEGELLDW